MSLDVLSKKSQIIPFGQRKTIGKSRKPNNEGRATEIINIWVNIIDYFYPLVFLTLCKIPKSKTVYDKI